MAYNWIGGPLSGIGAGLMAAGAGGWQQFAPAMAVGQQQYDQQQQMAQAQKLQELNAQIAQQRLEDDRLANTQAAEAQKRWDDMLSGMGPGLMAPGAAAGPGDQSAQLAPGLMQGGVPDIPPFALEMARAAGPEKGPNILAPFLTTKDRNPINVGGLLVDPSDPKHILADYSDVIRQNAAAGRQTTNVVLPKVESAYQNKFGGAQGEKAALISTEADTARKQMDALSTIEALRGAAQAAGGDVGALAPIKLKVGSYLQAVGLDPKEFELGPTGILQAIDSAANKLALSGIGQGGLPANNFSEADRNFIVSTVPSLADTPEGFQLKSLVLKKANSRTLEKEALWNSGKYDQTTEAGYQKFLTDWSNYVQAHPLFNDQERRAAEALKSGGKPTVVKTLPDGFN